MAVENNNISKVLPVAHLLTGSDTTNKLGKELEALKTNPEKNRQILVMPRYLADFGNFQITYSVLSLVNVKNVKLLL